jgi:hypothetical protein
MRSAARSRCVARSKLFGMRDRTGGGIVQIAKSARISVPLVPSMVKMTLTASSATVIERTSLPYLIRPCTRSARARGMRSMPPTGWNIGIAWSQLSSKGK